MIDAYKKMFDKMPERNFEAGIITTMAEKGIDSAEVECEGKNYRISLKKQEGQEGKTVFVNGTPFDELPEEDMLNVIFNFPIDNKVYFAYCYEEGEQYHIGVYSTLAKAVDALEKQEAYDMGNVEDEDITYERVYVCNIVNECFGWYLESSDDNDYKYFKYLISEYSIDW